MHFNSRTTLYTTDAVCFKKHSPISVFSKTFDHFNNCDILSYEGVYSSFFIICLTLTKRIPFSCPSFSLCLFPFLLHWLHLRTCRENRPTWATTWGFFKKDTVLSELFKEWSHESQCFHGKQNQIVYWRTRHKVIWYNPYEEKLLRVHETYESKSRRAVKICGYQCAVGTLWRHRFYSVFFTQWRETISVLDVMWPRSDRWKRSLMGKQAASQYNKPWYRL